MKKVDFESVKQYLLKQTSQAKENIKNYILHSYQLLPQDQSDISMNDLRNLLENTWNGINSELDKLSNYISNANEIVTLRNSKKERNEYKLESNSELNVFTSRDIQEENKEITRKFQNETNNYIDDNEQIENKNVAKFFMKVAQISRISYNVGKNIFNTMKEIFLKSKENAITLKDENFRKEFSFWIKNKEKEDEIKEKNKYKEYEAILNQENPFKKVKDTKEKKYLLNLYYELSIMYFHCHIAFPIVEIDFKTDENFNYEKMIDFINMGIRNRKVNFVILPALISNSSLLENGKSWVFTFTKNTFKFEDSIINENLNKLLNISNSDVKHIKDNLEITVFCRNNNDDTQSVEIITSFDLPKNSDHEFVLLIKSENKTFHSIARIRHFEIEKSWEIIECELKINNRTIISSKNVIKEY